MSAPVKINLVVKYGDPPHGTRGQFLCWLPGAITPIVLYRSTHSEDWRRGSQRVTVEAWAGPLPEKISRGVIL